MQTTPILRTILPIFSKADFARRENDKCKVWRRLLADVGQVQSNRALEYLLALCQRRAAALGVAILPLSAEPAAVRPSFALPPYRYIPN